MALNKRLLRKVRNRIAEIPESYDQSTWMDSSSKSPCGTTACLAGETVIAAAPSIPKGLVVLRRSVRAFEKANSRDAGIIKKARRLLGLNLEEASDMFDGNADGWPEPFCSRFQECKTQKAKARVAVAYLDECLKRGKVTW